MTVSAHHPEYDSYFKKWDLCKSAVDGLDETNGDRYIPQRSAETATGYKARLARAIYTNYTGRTLNGFAGAVFRKPLAINIPAQLQFMVDSFDSLGHSLEQAARRIFIHAMTSGRCGLLADYPQVSSTITLEQKRAQGIKPYIAVYSPESIINHKVQHVAGEEVLVLLTLKESSEASTDDEFEHVEEIKYRVFRMREGACFTQVYNEKEEPVGDEMPLLLHDGTPRKRIPFQFVGAQSNDSAFDKPPLIDIARLNIGHYRNTADHESNLSVHGCGTLIICSSMSKEEFDTRNPGGLVLGENTGVLLNTGDTATLLQLQAASAILSEMEAKEKRMIQIGARMISKGSSVEMTAEEARMSAASEHSVLDLVTSNVSHAITKSIADAAGYEGVDSSDISVSLNQEYWSGKFDPMVISALIMLSDRNLMTDEDIVRYLQNAGISNKDLSPEQIIEAIKESRVPM